MKQISSYIDLNGANSLQQLHSHIKFIRKLDAKLKRSLPDEIIEKFQLSNIDKGIATFHANSSAWATRLRYLSPKILSFFNSELGKNRVTSLRIRIHIENTKSETKRSISISNSAADFLQQQAINSTNEQLKECLLRLSKNTRDKQ